MDRRSRPIAKPDAAEIRMTLSGFFVRACVRGGAEEGERRKWREQGGGEEMEELRTDERGERRREKMEGVRKRRRGRGEENGRRS